MNIAVRRILLPTDFSEPSQQAAQYAMALADQFGAELHVLHVVAEVMPYADESSAWIMPMGETQERLKAAERQVAADVINQEWATNRIVVYKAVVGYAVDEILGYAKSNKIDLIVCGTHGHSWLAHALIGSVAEKVVRTASCPVLTVHPQGIQFVSTAAPQSQIQAAK